MLETVITYEGCCIYIRGQSTMGDPPTKMFDVVLVIRDLKKTSFYEMLHRVSDLRYFVNTVMNLRVP
jgi:hypothetical protein